MHKLSLVPVKNKNKKWKQYSTVETVIIRREQDFEIHDQLNPIEIKIDDDQVINVLKNIKVLPANSHQLVYYFRHQSKKTHVRYLLIIEN